MKHQLVRVALLLLLLQTSAFSESTDEIVRSLQERLSFLSLRTQTYKLKFVASPTSGRFQIIRLPSGKYPRSRSFLLQAGEESEDGQFRVDSFTKRKGTSKQTAPADKPELTITFLLLQQQFVLPQGIEKAIPTKYAELAWQPNLEKRFFVREGTVFQDLREPAHQLQLVNVVEDTATIKVSGIDGTETKFTVRKH